MSASQEPASYGHTAQLTRIVVGRRGGCVEADASLLLRSDGDEGIA